MVLNIILTVVSAILLLAGIIGCVVPVIPGPILSFTALLVISFAGGFALFSPLLLIFLGAAAIGVLTGTLLGIIVKLTVSGVITGFFIKGIRLLFTQLN